MSGTQVQWRGDTTAKSDAFTGANKEITIDTDKKVVVVHDGSTPGGFPSAREDHTHTGYITETNVADDTTPELSGPLEGNNEIASKLIFKDTAEVTQALGSISSNTTINLENGNMATCTIGSNLVFSFSNPPASGATGFLVLMVTNGGAYTITWPTGTVWDQGGAPTLQETGVDMITFLTVDEGITWRAVHGWSQT